MEWRWSSATAWREPARCALEIAEALQKHPELPVRMGIHSGPVSEVTDVSGRSNIAGGINMAQRVMDLSVNGRSKGATVKVKKWGRVLNSLTIPSGSIASPVHSR